jgi:N-acyl-D-amino-acid deacylase
MLDILIKNGLIVNGTGKDAYKGDIGIKCGNIVKIDNNIAEPCVKVIDAEGLVVSPGFIDVHSHNDLVPFMEEKIQSLKLMQGVTTELVGQCGLGIVPCVEDETMIWKNYIRGVVGDPGIKFNFHNLNEYIDKITAKGLKDNYAILISHGAIRTSIMEFECSKATKSEINEMCKLVEDAMKKGAFGMSLGLQYIPGIFSDKEELVALCKVVKKYDGFIMVHVRNHDNTIISALDEIVEVAEESGVKLHISHLKSYGSKELGCDADTLIEYVENVKAKEIDITFDEHLYLSGSTLMTQLLPPWLTDQGTEELIKNLNDKEVLNRLKEELDVKNNFHYIGWDNYSGIAGWDGILLTSLSKPNNIKYIGKTIGEIAKELNMHPVDVMAKLLIEEETGIGIVTINIFSEEDNTKLIKHPLQMVGSDSIPAGTPHPRLYGNYPLFIGKYVREKKVLTLEEAIYKATLLPAKTLGITDRGELAVNKKADITIFDFNEIKGYEEYRNPTKNPIGIKHVIVNGKIAVENEVVAKETFGEALRAR